MADTMPESAPENAEQHIYLTLDEDDPTQVLELVRVDGEDYYIRREGEWEQIDPDEDNPRVWDRVIVDVTIDAAKAFDAVEEAGPVIPLDAFTEYEIPDEDAA